MSNTNLQLWDAVRTPDPAFTKAFTRGGGFRGTATNAVYLIRMATEQWGPIGGNWGVDIEDEQYVVGAPLVTNTEGVPLAWEKIHVLRIKLRYPGGEVPGIGQTVFVGKNKSGVFTDEEAPKKSLTDALSKAMSWLGFAADIHLGLWDDNKYVSEVRKRFEESGQEPERKDVPRVSAGQAEEILGLIKAARVDQAAMLVEIGKRSGLDLLGVADIPEAAAEWTIATLKRKASKASKDTA